MTVLVHVSDLHFGREDPRLVDALGAAIQACAPDAVVVTGDLTQSGAKREFEAAARFLEALGPPALISPGNHDTPLINPITRAFAPFARFRKRIKAGADARLQTEGAWLRALNTARGWQLRLDWSLGVANDAQVRAAAVDLGHAPAGAARVLACHHPLVTPSNAPFPARTMGGEKAARRLADAGVDLVLTGHMHVAFAEALPGGDGRTYAVGAGTAVSRRTRGEPASFNQIRIEPDVIEVAAQVWREDGFHPDPPWRLERRTG